MQKDGANNGSIAQNISYYNEVAAQYDDILNRDPTNERMRSKVAERFSGIVPSGTVLDFGGGTGMDIPWLLAKGYYVIFCEPSASMKEKAMDRIRAFLPNQVVVLDNNACDYTTWGNKLPFLQKVDAILANFAVINCIPDIQLLFKNWSLITKPGAHLLILLLKSSFKKKYQSNRIATIRSLFSGRPVQTKIEFNGHIQTVTLYNTAQVYKASAPWFISAGDWPFPENDFTLIHLIRK